MFDGHTYCMRLNIACDRCAAYDTTHGPLVDAYLAQYPGGFRCAYRRRPCMQLFMWRRGGLHTASWVCF